MSPTHRCYRAQRKESKGPPTSIPLPTGQYRQRTVFHRDPRGVTNAFRPDDRTCPVVGRLLSSFLYLLEREWLCLKEVRYNGILVYRVGALAP